MPKTKQQIEQEFLTARQNKLNEVRNTVCLPNDFGKRLSSALHMFNFIAYIPVLNELGLLPELVTYTDRIHNWIMAGKSLKEISELPEAQIPKIRKHLQEIYDAGRVDYEHFDETYQLFEKELKNKKLEQLPEETIKEKIETYNLPKLENVPTEEDLLAKQKLFEEEKKHLLISESSPIGGTRILAYLIHDPKLSKQEQFELAEKNKTSNGRRELAKQVVDTLLNIDVEEIINSSPKEYAEHYIEWENKTLMMFDPSFFSEFKTELSTFLKPDEITDLEKYCKEIYTNLVTKKISGDLNHDNITNYTDIKKLTTDMLVHAASDKNVHFQGFANNMLVAMVDTIAPSSVKKGLNMQKNLRAKVVMHNPELVHDVPALDDNMWTLRGAEDPNAQRPWDKDLGNNTMPVQEIVEVQPQQQEPVEIFEGEPWISKNPRVTPELRDFTVSLYNLMIENHLDPDSDLNFDMIKKYEEGDPAGKDMLSKDAVWGVAVGDFKKGNAYMNMDYFVNLLNDAKQGKLVFVKPGTLIADAKPIVVGEDGKISLSNEKSAPAQNDPKANDAKYAQDCLARSKQIQLKVLSTDNHMIEGLMPNITKEAYKKGISEESFVAQIMAASTDTDENLAQIYKQAYKNGQVEYNLKFKTFSNNEIQKRKEISETALKNYALSAYRSFAIKRGLDDLLQSGEITFKEYKQIDKNRDFCDLMFDRGETPEIINANKERAKKFLGKGLDPKDPDYKDKLQRAQAEVFNERMEKLLDFDYERYEKMNDKEFAENYGEYHATMKPLSIFRAEYLSLAEDNKYINRELGEQVIDKEDLYGGLYFVNSTRIRAMADPTYATMDFDELTELNYEQKEAFCSLPDFTEVNIHSYRFMTDVNAAWDAKKQEFFHKFQYSMNPDNPNKPLERAPLFYNDNGDAINQYDLYDYMKQGKIAYVARQGNPYSLTAFSFDYKKNRLTKLDTLKKLKPEIKESIVTDINEKARAEAIDNATKKINSAQNDEAEKRRQYFKNKNEAYGQFLNSTATITRGLTDFIHEAHKKKLSVEKYSDDYAYRIYSDGPRMSYDEFCEKIGVPDNEKISKADIDHRKALSASAAKTVFRWHETKYQGTDFEMKTNFNGFTSRVFTSVMLEPGKENLEKNKQAYKTITTGTAAEKKKLIEDRLNDLMTRGEKFFGKEYSDEELTENIDELLLIGTAAGMEMDGFNSALTELKKEGVEIDRNILDKMAQYREKFYQYNNYYNARIDYIASMYYQYGGEKQYRNQDKVTGFAHDESDWEFAKSSTGMMTIALSGSIAVGDVLKEKLQAEGKKIEAFYSTDGKNLGNDSFEVASKYIDGGDVVVYYEGDPKPQLLSLSNMDTLNPLAQTKEMPLDVFKRVSASRFDAKLDALDKMNYSPERKSFEEGLLSDQYRLALAMSDVKNPENNELIKDLTASLVTKVVISKMCDSKGTDAELQKTLISDASVAQNKRNLLKSNIAAEIVKQLPKDIEGIMALGKADLFKTVIEANTKQAKAEIKEGREKSNTKLANYFAGSKLATEKLKAGFGLNKAVVNPEFWGMTADGIEKIRKATALTGLSLDRASAQTICFAKMLSDKKKYSVEDILDPNKLTEEKKQAAKEISAVISGSNGKSLSENAEILTDILGAGLVRCTDYVADQTRNIKNFDIKEIAKPENQKLLAAVRLIKDLNQEYSGAFENLPKGTQKPDNIIEHEKKADAFGHIFRNICMTESIITGNAERVELEAENDMVLNGLRSSFMSYLINKNRNVPGNENKAADELIDPKTLISFYMMAGNYTTDHDFLNMCDAIKNGPDLREKLVRCISDGSFADVFKFEVKEEDGMPKLEFDMKKALTELIKLPSKSIEKNVVKQQEELKKDEAVKGMI